MYVNALLEHRVSEQFALQSCTDCYGFEFYTSRLYFVIIIITAHTRPTAGHHLISLFCLLLNMSLPYSCHILYQKWQVHATLAGQAGKWIYFKLHLLVVSLVGSYDTRGCVTHCVGTLSPPPHSQLHFLAMI